MQLTNLHSLTITLFIILILGGALLLFRFWLKREKIKKKYFLLFNQSTFYYIKYLFLFLSLTTISVGLFGIKYGEKTSKQEMNGIDLAFVLDVSKSMNALDFKDGEYSVSRLSFAKALIAQYIGENPENRYGLVIFAGDAISSSPLTTDHSTFLTFLQNVDYKNLNKQGTNLEKAIELGVGRLFSQQENETRAKALVILSDGGDNDTQVDFDSISNTIEGKNITSFVVGVGKKSGVRIPTSQDFVGNIVYQKYKGEYVITKLNSSTLSSLSSTLNGEFIRANSVGDLEKISNKLKHLEKRAIEVAGGNNKKDAGRILGIVSLVLFLVYILIRPRIRAKH